MTLYGTPGLSKSICFIICSSVPIICSAFLIRCGTPLVICAIYDFISCAFVVICSTFVVICYGFGTICGVCVIICSDFSIITTFCRSISTVLSLYRVVYALYGVQTILPRVHFAYLLSFLRYIEPLLWSTHNAKHACRIQAPRSLTPPFWFIFAGKLKANWRAKWSRWPASSNDISEVIQLKSSKGKKITPDII